MSAEDKDLSGHGGHEPLPDGEEAPPPLVRTMSAVRWGLLIGLSLFAVIMILTAIGITPLSVKQSQTTQYHCPMHPTYISNQPGECPICGMTLVPISDTTKITQTSGASEDQHQMSNQQTAKKVMYTCPMDPEVISDKPGKCPKCGMDLVPITDTTKSILEGPTKALPSTQSGAAQTGMDEMSGMPGMQETPKVDTTNNMGSAPVPGLVPVTIEPERLQLINVRTAMVERRVLGGELNLVGYITPDETRLKNLHVRVSGWVEKLFVNETGQFVRADQPLLSLYSQDLYQAQEDFLSAQAAANQASSDSSLTTLRQQLFLAARERLHLMALSDQEIEQLEKTEKASQLMTLRSPFSGYVMEKSVVTGQYVGPEQNLFTIVDLSSVWVMADVYEQDSRNIKVGQPASLRIASYPGEIFEGKVEFIYPFISENTRTLKVRLALPNPSLRLRPGMYAEIQVTHSGGEMLAAPAEAIMDGGEIQYAFVVHNGKHFEPRKVTIGQATDDWVEILSGLEEGEEIVTSANFLIDSESRLKAAVAGMGSMPGMPDMPATSSQTKTH